MILISIKKNLFNTSDKVPLLIYIALDVKFEELFYFK